MLPGECGAHGVLTDRGVAAADLVGDQSTAVSHSVAEDAPVALSPGNGQSGGIDKIRQVTGCAVICPEVCHLEALSGQIGLDLFLHLCSCVVVCHCDLHSMLSFHF